MTATFSPTELRASGFARCPRMEALRARGAAPSDLDEQAQEYLHRGHYFEELVVRRIVARYGRDDVERQVEIDWGFGTGHADAYVRSEKALVEIKSSSTPTYSTPMYDMSVAQLELYLHFHPEAEQGWLMLIDPNRMRPEDVVTVRLTDEKQAEIQRALDALRIAIEGGPLPARVCSRPSQARGRFCPFAATCFEGWEPEAPATITDPDTVDLAAQLYAIRQNMRPAEGTLKALKEDEAEIKGLLSEALDVGESTVGPYTVKRTHVVRSPRFSDKLARAAGFPMHSLDEFMVAGSEYDTLKVTLAEEAGDIDYGDEAPF